MIFRLGLAFERSMAFGCDAKCHKAWGISHRPAVQLSDNEDDYEYLSDDELDEAPRDPGTYEGGQGKPIHSAERLNKWCFRECERSVEASVPDGVVELPDFSKRIRNIPEEKP